MLSLIHFLDEQGTVIDSIPVDYEDAFTLDPLGDLCQEHHDKGKAFIIARVLTQDPKQPEKNFYSYYSAFQLNKILFQTQTYHGKRLLHRLWVLNPLTNSDIIGDVEYFSVEGLGYYKDPEDDVRLTSSPLVLSPGGSAPKERVTHMHQVEQVAETEPLEPAQVPIKHKLKIQTQKPDKEKSVMIWNAVRVGTDDHFLRKSEMRKLFRENALVPEDAKLFQMPDVNTDNDSDDESPQRRRRRGSCHAM
ncbi:hypothetical protein EDD86DRAFT_189849 [Gorgonomyces haynaldii]|nr:hypothetical protein EDD86DRAFT_189849 [Gorgonomyces haynaldii]